MKRFAMITALFAAQTLSTHADTLPGYDSFDLFAAHRARPIAASIWYPAAGPTYRASIGDGPIFEPVKAFIGPEVASGRHPLVLLSHGSGGNAQTLGWLTMGLVAKGAIVLAVNHPGSTSGDSSPRRSADLASRAMDLRAALDSVLADPAFASHVDESHIGAVGFSLGGATVLGMAGLRFDGAAQDEACRTGPEAADCAFFHKGGVRFADYPGFSQAMDDERITRTVAIDPGFGGAVTQDSLADVTSQIMLINLGDESRMPAVDLSRKGNNLAGRLSEVDYEVIEPANHFTFLGLCKPTAIAHLEEEDEDPICSDPEGADRQLVHDRLIEGIATGLGL